MIWARQLEDLPYAVRVASFSQASMAPDRTGHRRNEFNHQIPSPAAPFLVLLNMDRAISSSLLERKRSSEGWRISLDAVHIWRSCGLPGGSMMNCDRCGTVIFPDFGHGAGRCRGSSPRNTAECLVQCAQYQTSCSRKSLTRYPAPHNALTRLVRGQRTIPACWVALYGWRRGEILLGRKSRVSCG